MRNDEIARLKEACQLTGAAWAVILGRESAAWSALSGFGLTDSRLKLVGALVKSTAVRRWLDNLSRRGSKIRSKSTANTRLGAPRIYGFPVSRAELLLVGAKQQSPRDQHLWRLTAEAVGARSAEALMQSAFGSLEAALGSDMKVALEKLLRHFVAIIQPQGAWLGISRGDTLSVEAQWKTSRISHQPIEFHSSPPLERVRRSREHLLMRRPASGWEGLPNAMPGTATYWAGFPLVVGNRLIGVVGLWGTKIPDPAQVRELNSLANAVSQPAEIIVTLNELSGQLRRLATLNDFALAVTSAQDLVHIARRVLAHLNTMFPNQSAALYVPSLDGRLVHEFRGTGGRFSARQTSLAGHAILPFLRGGKGSAEAVTVESRPRYSGAPSQTIVPLRFRRQIVGALALESAKPVALSQQDEHLVAVVAGHLAGVVEYGRLRAEAEDRARHLSLIHEVVQQVIGLTDKQRVAQVTADLLSRYFAYERADVVLAPDSAGNIISGVAGTPGLAGTGAVDQDSSSLRLGIPAHVLSTGESLLVNNTGLDKRFQGTATAMSEMCVALKHGGQILGLIDVRSSRPNAFSGNDLLAMESLAGLISTVISGATQFARLEDTVRQLQAAQAEVDTRFAAQQEAESRLVQAAKLVAVGEMAAGIAHELNNPLTTVTGFAELILDEMPADAQYRSDVEMVLRESLRARGVVRRLLDFARQGEQVKARTDINEIVDDVLGLTSHFIHTSGVQLDLALGKELPWVAVDSNQMKQVFLNLVHNALHAMPSGGNLQIRTLVKSRSDRDWVVVEIADSGIGIDPKDINRIFEPFFTTRANHGGTGLGLSVTFGIVTDHGGTIEVESQPGAGSKFSVWLPT